MRFRLQWWQISTKHKIYIWISSFSAPGSIKFENPKYQISDSILPMRANLIIIAAWDHNLWIGLKYTLQLIVFQAVSVYQNQCNRKLILGFGKNCAPINPLRVEWCWITKVIKKLQCFLTGSYSVFWQEAIVFSDTVLFYYQNQDNHIKNELCTVCPIKSPAVLTTTS